MQSVLRRVASVVCVLVFAQTAVTLCAGWQATPEARRQRCQDGACPLHHHHHNAGSARTDVTQAAADDCCAQSPLQESSPSKASFASTITLAVLRTLPAVVLTPAPAVAQRAPWETPSPPAHVPKYLLLSVLLV